MKISIVIPIYNEEESVGTLYEKIVDTMNKLPYDYEIIAVDDGSTDNTFNKLKEIASKDKRLKVISFKRNYGQTAAMFAGFQHASGDVVITMDADLQNDPADIPILIEKINEGYDVVSGWRKDRKDPFFSRTLPSKIANYIISNATGVYLHDYGCSLKAYKKDIAKNFRLYGDMHRFLPALAKGLGAKITEVPVSHHPRLYGKSKYGIGRTIRVILDIFLVKFLNEYINKPLYAFGGIGFILFSLGFLSGLYLTYDKLINNQEIGQRPLLFLTVLLIISGLQFISTGIIAEVIIRTYYESQDIKPYRIKDAINIENIDEN
ncbi:MULTISPECIES: glycosyltransferase family 2 protein [unclassified Hydrogenobaculum]|uniref:glycosyltransferase family 2 protein n=1 Tax=unclassified Hydrogenobaculum TaxID=2622382 RepID=UPI0001C5033F|nr:MULTISPECIES: glycosyltransferase family 2 protein [unclassified Hydrogenobaculum]AEF19744.1 glycosyl transferase family 2 [Hydrogenobaculum sp. 3684]AEG47031.1 glycosyl transferase family 2 [Hydrogenobaculum sp. SHO]AGG15679.1 glycosyl transferase family 2 [Hydrogenobaculum sp. HO]AGH93978.1 glycosyl transferase [Hydrogenobaculum sp. SN]